MNLHDFDWVYVRRHTTLPLTCAAVSLLLVSGAIWAHSDQMELFQKLDADRSAVHEDYDVLVEQRRIIDRYHRRYRQFFDLGFIGHESRLDWVETMRTATAELELPRLSYSIEPQLHAVVPLTSRFGDDNLKLRVSNIQLEISLVHELDLLRFFDALQRQAPGLITVGKCDVEKIGAVEVNVAEANLLAACEAKVFSVITSDIQGETI